MYARFSTPVQTGPGTHPASCTMGNRSFPAGVNQPGHGITPIPIYTSTPCLHLHEPTYTGGMVSPTLVSLSHQYCIYSTGKLVDHRRFVHLRESILPMSVIKDSKVAQAHLLHRPGHSSFFCYQITRDK